MNDKRGLNINLFLFWQDNDKGAADLAGEIYKKVIIGLKIN